MFLNLGGTIRTQSAQETLARLRPLFPLFGITRVAAQEGLTEIKIPVSICFRPNARLLSTSQGKGISRDLADVSAIMEGIEQFHVERIPPPDLIESPAGLRKSGKTFVDPVLLSMNLYRMFYSEDDPIGWLSLKRLSDQEPILIPRAFLDLNSATPRTEISSRSFDVSTNGLASGNSLEEAIVHGLYEMIERHSIMEVNKMNFEEKSARTLKLATIQKAPHIEELVKRIDEAGYNLEVLACHGRLGIPTFKAFIQAHDPLKTNSVSQGSGAHYLPEVALSRAITEAVQTNVTAVTGSRDDLYPDLYLQYDPAFAEYVPIAPPTPGKLNWSDVPRAPDFSSFAEALRWTLGVLESHGFNDICFYNHQRPEYGNIPVVSVVIPGSLFELKTFHPENRR